MVTHLKQLQAYHPLFIILINVFLFFSSSQIEADATAFESCLSLSRTFPSFNSALADNNKFYDSSYVEENPEWLVAKILYENGTNQCKITGTFSIPPIFHLIWLGSQVPNMYIKLQQKLQELHPGFIVKLWTDKEIKDYPLINRKAFEAATNYAEKSDIWRYEILYNEGGMYLDGDFEIIKPFNELFTAFDFFVGMSQDHSFSLCNGLIGAIPHHPILKRCIKELQVNTGDSSQYTIMNRSGPYYFTRCFLKSAKEENLVNIALPPSFFYPWPHYLKDYKLTQSLFLKPYSYALHLWNCSWHT